MDFLYQVKINQLDRWEASRQTERQQIAPEDIEPIFAIFNQEVNSYLDKDGNCLMPKENQGTIRLCWSDKVQMSHVISEPVLKRIASPTNPPGRLEVLEQSALVKNHIAQATKGHPKGMFGDKRPWQIGRVPPQKRNVSVASCRGFSCNPCDAKTFRNLESQKVEFPEPNGVAQIHDEGNHQNNPLLHDQLFLLSYRAVTASISELRGSTKAMEIAATPQKDPFEHRRLLQLERALELRRITATRLEPIKTLMDYRVAQIHQIPMVHYLVPITLPVPTTGCHVVMTPESTYYTETIYPEDGNGGQTWIILSCLEKDFFKIHQYMMEHAQWTIHSNNEAIRATNLFITVATQYHFGYFQPEGYQEFCKNYPDLAEYIEETQARLLVDTWHEFLYGPP